MTIDKVRIGVDLAQYGRDPTVIAVLLPGRQRAQVEKLGGAWDIHQMADHLQALFLRHNRAVEMTIEGTGLGSALVDALRSRGIPVREAPAMTMAEALIYAPEIEAAR